MAPPGLSANVGPLWSSSCRDPGSNGLLYKDFKGSEADRLVTRKDPTVIALAVLWAGRAQEEHFGVRDHP